MEQNMDSIQLPRFSELKKYQYDLMVKKFRDAMDQDGEVSFENFEKMINSRNEFFVKRVFKMLDRDDSGKINMKEYLDTIYDLITQPYNKKVEFLFNLYDINGDGLIEISEIAEIMKASVTEEEVTFSSDEIYDLICALFADDAQSKTSQSDIKRYINFDDFNNQLSKHPILLQNLTKSIERWLLEPSSTRSGVAGAVMKHIRDKFRPSYVRNNLQSVLFFTAFVLINIALVVTACYQYRSYNSFVIIARACGRCLNFCSSFALLLVLRRTLSTLRSYGFASFLPLDDSVYFHKLTGNLIFICSLIHTIMHVWNFASIVGENNLKNLKGDVLKVSHDDEVVVIKSSEYWSNDSATEIGEKALDVDINLHDFLFTTKPGIGWLSGSACVTGWALLIVLLVMVIAAHPCVRRSHMFEIFFFTHLLFLPYFALLIVHAPNFWQWLLIPGLMYLAEIVIKFWEHYTRRGQTYITQATLLPSKVTQLLIKRPDNFYFSPGDYVYLNVPTIAKYEWHPFTISSAPETTKHLSLHIRGVGQWTNRLYEYFEDNQPKSFMSVNLGFEPDELSYKTNLNLNSSSLPLKNESITNNIVKEQENKGSSALLTRASSDVTLNNSSIPNYSRNLLRSNTSSCYDKYILDSSKSLALYASNLRESGFCYLRKTPNIISVPVIEEDCSLNEVISNGSISHQKEKVDNIWPQPIPVYVMGPYGSPSSDIFTSAEHAVLIATGIGVTPFASILQSIMHRYREAMVNCPKCEHRWMDKLPITVLNLRKVDFFWINRDQRSFEWFLKLLSQLEIEQAEMDSIHQSNNNSSTAKTLSEHFLDLHMYITSATEKSDVKAVFLQMALELMHQKEKRDRITGLKTRTKAGRPDWDKVFKDIAQRKKGKVTVFFCGSPHLGRILRLKCNKFGFKFKKEKF